MEGEPVRGPDIGWSLTHPGTKRRSEDHAGWRRLRKKQKAGHSGPPGHPRAVDRHLALCDPDQLANVGNRQRREEQVTTTRQLRTFAFLEKSP